MPSPLVVNVDWGDVVTTTLELRRKKLRSNIINNNAVLAWLKEGGRMDPFAGGREIMEEFDYANNETFMWYSGFEPLNINLNDTMTAARFPIKQASIAVVISGLETVQNSGTSAMMSLIDARVKTAERTFWNQMSAGVYSDGTGYGGKQIGGLASIISKVPTVGVVGGIDAAANTWWQNYALDQTSDPLGAITSTNIQAYMNKAAVNVKRNSEGIDLYVADNNLYLLYLQSLQAIQRITDGGGTKVGSGFTSLKYFGAGKSVDVILDGGKGGQIPANTMYGINSEYLYFRPSSTRNFDVIGGDRANSNQDAIIRIYGWAGNMTVSNRSLQAVIF